MNEQTIFSEAIELDPVEQQAYLDKVCIDVATRERVDRLLNLHRQSSLLVDKPAVDAAVSDLGALKKRAEQGQTIGPYKLLEQLGEGGMGIVYMAEQREPVKRKVALKIIKPGMDTKQVLARFESERQALAMMEHANIARVLEAGETEQGRPYFVMELVRGMPLTEYCDRENVGIRDRLKLFLEVCKAVQHAHLKGIIHRDIKPSNILVSIFDGEPVIKMIDFGVAKAMNAQLTERTLFTNYAQIIGTPLYMSPEQAELSGLDVDTRSDIYSLGVLLYELLTGTTPFGEQELKEVGYDEMRRIIREVDPPKPSTRVSTLGAELETEADKPRRSPQRISDLLRGELDWITIKSLEKKRDRRYQTVLEFADDIQRYLDNEPVRACPPSQLYAIQKFVSKHRGGVVTVALTSILLIAGTAISTAFAFRANRAESIASTASEIAEEKADVAQAISLFLRDDLLRASLADGARDAGLSLQEALDQAAVQIEGRFKDTPLIEAEIRSVLGLAYESLGEIPTAKHHFDRALNLFEKTRGTEHVDTLRAEFRRVRLRLTYDKTSSLSDVERSAAAADALKDLLRRQEASLGTKNEYTLVTKGFLALCYSRMERYREAMQLFDDANSAFAETLPPTDPRAIHCLEQTAACLSAQGRDTEANAVLARRPKRRHDYGEDAPEKSEAIVAEMREMVRSRELALGRFDPRTLEACTRLADALLTCKRLQEAERVLQRTLSIQVEQLGDEHPETNATRTRLAELFFEASDPVKAAEQYRAVLRSHPNPGTKILQYARAMCEMLMFSGNFRESSELRGELAAAQARLHGELDSRSLRSFREQVIALAQIQDVDAMQSVVDHIVQLVGEDHIESLASRMWVGSALQKLERFVESRTILQSTYDRARDALGEEHVLAVQTGTVLAVTLHQCGDVLEAESLQRRMLAVNEKTAGERSFAMFRSVTHLSSLCIELDKIDEAYELVLRGAEIRKHIKEHDHHIIKNGSKIADLLEELQAKGVEIDLDVYEATLMAVRDAATRKGDTKLADQCVEKLSGLATGR